MKMKDYLNNLLCAAAPEDGRAQDALEHAITSCQIPTSLDFEADVRACRAHLPAALACWDRILHQNPETENPTHRGPERKTNTLSRQDLDLILECISDVIEYYADGFPRHRRNVNRYRNVRRRVERALEVSA